MIDAENTEREISGISASPGICIGKAYIVGTEGVNVVEKYFIKKSRIKNELNRFKTAVKKSKEELRAIIEEAPEDFREHADILEAQEELLKDKMLYGRTIKTIEDEGVNAEWALKKVVTKVKTMFQNMNDSYLKERAVDIAHVSDRIMRNLVGVEQINIKDIRKRVILVAPDLSPAETSQINLERIKGFVTDRGGKTSHTGIIARTLEIPAVLGLENATRLINNDDLIVVDGISGKVIINPSESTLVEYEDQSNRYSRYMAEITRNAHQPAKTVDNVHYVVQGNIEMPEEVVAVHSHGGDGIGLYRTEFQYMGRPDFPGEEELFNKYRDVIEVMENKPVTIRTLDINGDKARTPGSGYAELNPALGLRGIRYCLKKPDIFRTQLRAILRASAYGNVRIMFPMISNYHEVLESKRLFFDEAERLDKEGIRVGKNIKIGILMEVPSAVIMADLMAKEVDFFSIGTNDLIQYTLAIDRGNKQVAHLYQPFDLAILRMIKHLVDVAGKADVKVYMCGEMAAYPMHMPILLGLGLDELSMNPQSIPAVKRAIRKLNLGESKEFIKRVLKKTTAREVFDMVQDTYGNTLSFELPRNNGGNTPAL